MGKESSIGAAGTPPPRRSLRDSLSSLRDLAARGPCARAEGSPLLPFVVAAEEEGSTLGAALRRRSGGMTWSEARSLVSQGHVLVDGGVVSDPAARLARGQSVEIREAAETVSEPLVRIVHLDRDVAVIDKPAGVSTVPYERGETGTAIDLLRQTLKPKKRGGSALPLYVVHRLDKDTSGLLVFARTPSAERALGRLFRTHEVERTYLTVAHGVVASGRIESRLVRDRGDGLRGSTLAPGGGKRAVTHVKVVKRLKEATVCRVRLETGKTHQIRIHLAEAGHPIVGERVYIRDYRKAGKTPFPSPRLLLHAETLGFVHPGTGARLRFTSPLPADFRAVLDGLG